MTALVSGAIILCYLAAFAAVEYVVVPLQASVVTGASVASFMFLPHGVRALCAVFVGWRGVPALWVAHVLGYLLIWRPDFELGPVGVLAITGVGALSAQVVWSAMRAANLSISPAGDGVISWRVVVFLGVSSSFVNSLGSTAVISMFQPATVEVPLTVVAEFALGDAFGVVGLLLLLVALRRASNWWGVL